MLLQIDMCSNERTTSRAVLCLAVASYGVHFEEGHEFDSSVALGGNPETEKKKGILKNSFKDAQTGTDQSATLNIGTSFVDCKTILVYKHEAFC